MPELDEDKRAKSTGPKSPEGKESSSHNSTKHGMRAKKLVILPDESQADYDEIEQGWREEFQPDGYQEERLVKNLVFNDWMLNRAQRRVMEAEVATGEDGLPTTEQQHQLELTLRYKTTLERAFYRAWEALRGLRKDILREKQEVSKLHQDIEALRKMVEAKERPPKIVGAASWCPDHTIPGNSPVRRTAIQRRGLRGPLVDVFAICGGCASR